MNDKNIITSITITLRVLLFIAIGVFCGAEKLAAQSNNYGYDKDDYDGDYEYQHEYYDTEAEINQTQKNRFIRRTLREEELYNGGYRNKAEDGNGAGIFQTFGTQDISRRNNNDRNSSTNNNRNNPMPPRDWRSLDNPGSTNPDNAPGVFNSDGSTSGGGKEVDPGEREPESPPPPPDEPDVPVDTAIPFLLIGGIALVTWKFKLSRSL